MRANGLGLALAIGIGAMGAVSIPAQPVQADTLGDIRQDLGVLHVEIQRLKRELSTTGAANTAGGSGSILDRVNAIEGELQRLTGQTEELEFRIGQVVRDGTNRVGDLEFRLCELEPGCDIGALGETSTLGGGDAGSGAGTTGATSTTTTSEPETQMAVGEQADFKRASEALAQGDFRGAATLFETFRETYPGSPLEAEALIGLGQAQESAGDLKAAARAYLDSFSGYPEAPSAPDALFRLGLSLDKLGQRDAACQMLAQLEARYPGADQVLEAKSAMRNMGCT